jgi:hypothetical protein
VTAGAHRRGRDGLCRGARWNRSIGRKAAAQAPTVSARHDRAGSSRAVRGRREICVAPVDADVVAFAREHRLLHGSHARDGEPAHARIFELDDLVGRVHGDLGADVEI